MRSKPRKSFSIYRLNSYIAHAILNASIEISRRKGSQEFIFLAFTLPCKVSKILSSADFFISKNKAVQAAEEKERLRDENQSK